MNATRRWVPALLLVLTLGACDTDRLLDLQPEDQISTDISIVDAGSAQAALYGAYSALENTSYYGGDYLMWSETLTDNVEHTGTFDQYADADLLFLRPDVGGVYGMWTGMYDAINRVNLIIQKVPGLDGISADQADLFLGQAHGLRALHYFNLTRGWGDVPLVLVPPESLDEAAQVTRAPVSQVFEQIELDLSQARDLLSGGDPGDPTFVTLGFLDALEARVALFQEDWAGAVSAARAVVASGDYALAPSYGQLFTANGDPTFEDIFRVIFSETNQNNHGFYYQYAGRFEIGATQTIYDLYEAGDARHAVNFGGTDQGGIEVIKFPTTVGSENVHVIRYADVLLILAEGLAEQGGTGNLDEAVGLLNQIRGRAGVDPYDYGVDLTSAAEVLDAIYLERRLELAFEGEYWFDLVRTERAATALGSFWEPHMALWPIPVAEMDVAPNLVQNPGY